VSDPDFQSTRFTCPRCNEEADQVWLNAYAAPIANPEGVPLRIAGAGLEMLKQNPAFPPEVRDQKVAYWNRVNGGDVFLDRWAPVQTDLFVAGMELSVCRSCTGLSVWLGGELLKQQD
jgi:hypothetical protein